MNTMLYYLAYFFLYLHSLLPFRVLYIMSDCLYFLVYYIIKYRRNVVSKNLSLSFPDKNKSEIKQIEKHFYKHFCDYFVETIKLLHVSDKEMKSRIQFENIELIEDLLSKNRSCILSLGHYGNWEWVPSINLFLKTKCLTGQIYRPLKNKAFDRIFLKIRSRFGSISIPKNQTLRAMIGFKQAKQQVIIGFIADQTPSRANIHYWTNFLHQETPVFTGIERIAKKTDDVVIYLDVSKVKRGHYIYNIKLLSEHPKEEPKFFITEKYMRSMETTILRNPAYWLWTHKRWKYKKEDFVN